MKVYNGLNHDKESEAMTRWYSLQLLEWMIKTIHFEEITEKILNRDKDDSILKRFIWIQFEI